MAVARQNAHRYTIVGVDPGTTVGVAILDLNGKLLSVFSSKNCTFSSLINRIISYGKPLVVATDVSPTPSTVKKISTIFASVLHELNESMSVEYKERLTRGYKCKNTHERDALAACLDAFHKYKTKFSQIRKKLPPNVPEEEVKAMVIRGISIKSAINKLKSERKEEEETAGSTGNMRGSAENGSGDANERNERDVEILHSEILRLKEENRRKDEEIRRLRSFCECLKRELSRKEQEIRELERKIAEERSEKRREVLQDREVKRLKAEIERLNAELREIRAENDELREIVEELRGERVREGMLRVKILRNFSKKAIEELESKFGLNEGDVIFIEDGSGGGPKTAEMLAEKGIRAVIYGKNLSHFAYERFAALGVPTFHADEIPLRRGGDFALVEERILRRKIAEMRKKTQTEEEKVLLSV